MTRDYQPTASLTSTCPQKGVKHHPVSLGGLAFSTSIRRILIKNNASNNNANGNNNNNNNNNNNILFIQILDVFTSFCA